MTKTKRQPVVPLDRLHKHFSATSQWSDRWESSLYPALLKGTQYTLLRNTYASQSLEVREFDGSPLIEVELPTSSSHHVKCLVHREADAQQSFPEPARSTNGLNTHWNLDLASVLAVSVLDVQPGDKMLDLCAAPGGKSVTLAQIIFGAGSAAGCLHANEFDFERMKRLDDNLRQYIPAEHRQTKRLLCLHLDGTSSKLVCPLGIGGYDKVLLDAPCSSERHIIHAQDRAAKSSRVAEELTRWSPLMAKRLAETQSKLLQNALRCVRANGRVLYATCSISKEENDEVIEKTVRWTAAQQTKGALSWTCEPVTLPDSLGAWAERTQYGWIVLPDHDTPYGRGWGPLYFAVLTKVKD